MGCYIGKDGKMYDTWGQREEADARYEQHREQKKLLEEQNKLLKQQQDETSRLERYKILKQKEMQEQQMKHEEKMRILKLFDDAGINKDSYYNFIDYLFCDIKDTQLSTFETIKNNRVKIENDVKNIKKYLKNPDDGFKYIEYLFPNEREKLKERKLMLEKFLNSPSKKTPEVIKYLEETFPEESNVISKKAKSGFIKFFIIFAIGFTLSFLLLISEISGLEILGIIFMIITLVISLYSLFNGIKNSNYNELVEKALAEIELSIKNPVYNQKDQAKEALQKAEEVLKEHDKTIKDFSSKLENILLRWNDFIEFRKTHYNSKIENILIETGVKERVLKLDFKYPKINNQNKNGDGTIEDYIAYFDNAVDSSSEQE